MIDQNSILQSLRQRIVRVCVCLEKLEMEY